MLRAPSESEIDGKRRDEKVVVDSRGYRAGKVDDAGRRERPRDRAFLLEVRASFRNGKGPCSSLPECMEIAVSSSTNRFFDTFNYHVSIDRKTWEKRIPLVSFDVRIGYSMKHLHGTNDGNYRAKRSRKSARDIWKIARHVAYGCELTASEKQYRRQFYQGLFSADRTQPIH